MESEANRVRLLLLSPQRRLLMFKHRHLRPDGIEEPSWVTIGGGREPGETIEQTARRELAEETGLRAENWERLGQIHGADSLSNHVDHIFLATGLTQGEPDLGPGESDLRVRTMPFCRALDLVRQGMLPHAGSSHALLVMALRRTAQ